LPLRAKPGPSGVADPSLSPLGNRQAERLIGALEGKEFSEIFCSPALRALETLQPVSKRHKAPPQIVPELLEYHQVGAEYVPIQEIKRAGGPEWDQILRGELPSYLDGGAFRHRVVSAIEALISNNSGRKSVLIVCHGGVINAYLAHVLGIQRGLAFPLDHASISRVLASQGGRRTVQSVNETKHVQDLLDQELL
jgi:broad specificity phosphatase PhoE